MNFLIRSLAGKLTLAFLAVGLTVALLVGAFIWLSSAGQLERLVVDQQRSEYESILVTYYQSNGSWNGVEEYLRRTVFQPRGEEFPPAGDNHPQPGGEGRRGPRLMFGLADPQGNIVLPLFPEYPNGSHVPEQVLAQGEPLELNGQMIGVLITAPRPPGLNPAELAYLQRATVALLVASAGAVLVALLVGALLARTLTRPLRALTHATHRMAGGELEQEVDVGSADEIGELATAFNQMSRELARANLARRQMTADIAHEIRTPLTVIAGYIESMRDGVLAATPERLSVIYSEIDHLQRLVGDLRTLSQADAGRLKLNRQPLAPLELLAQARAAFEHQAAQNGIRLELVAGGSLPDLNLDETRMAQVLSNLITNALRFTPVGGRVTLGAAQVDGQVRLTVTDTGQGIAPEDLPFVFERFYRADKSRSEDSGESGLGLSIAKALVEAHGGRLTVQSAPGRGSTFEVLLPA
jgi:signal transduction histidine kinase